MFNADIVNEFRERLGIVEIQLVRDDKVSAIKKELSEIDEKISEILNCTKDQAYSLRLLGLQRKIKIPEERS